MLLNWFNAISASVFGGEPQPRHSNSPLQSPVSHMPRPLASKVHWVRPQMRAIVVPYATEMDQVWPGSSWRPPLGEAAAQTV